MDYPNKYRKHSYLPGVCLPLYPEEWLMKKNPSPLNPTMITDEEDNDDTYMKTKKDEPLIMIPILPVVSVFLFPGTQLPMRIRQQTWAHYIAKAIQDSRRNTNGIQQVRIGIVTLIRNRGISLDQIRGLIGKIGTLATVTYTHEQKQEEEEDEGRGESNSYETRVHGGRLIQEEEVIITLLGTSRFRVISRVETNTNQKLPMYGVTEIMDDDEFTIPQEIQYRPHYVRKDACQLLSDLTSISSVALKAVWPWTIIDMIVNEILHNDVFEGFRNIPSTSGYIVAKDEINHTYAKYRSKNANAMAFSFWLANTLPMSEDDRVDLLEKTCTVERLLCIRNYIRSQDKVQYLRCVHCNAKIGRVTDIFTLDGTDGANGAYVNPHGIIHQTWSVRQVCENSVFTVGEAEIQDSWFPGYAWTIALCGHCFCHIGWQYTQVVPSSSQAEVTNNPIKQCRPRTFWGISQANIQMFSL